jgi:hypothetical protein
LEVDGERPGRPRLALAEESLSLSGIERYIEVAAPLEETMSNPKTPTQSAALSFKALLRANLAVLTGVGVFVALAYLLWRGIAALFPEIGWLQGPLN